MIDPDRRTITVDGKAIRPSRMIFELCRLLHDGRGIVFNRTQIMEAAGISEETYDVAAQKLVSRARALGIYQIKTSWGSGYYWDDTAAAKSEMLPSL